MRPAVRLVPKPLIEAARKALKLSPRAKAALGAAGAAAVAGGAIAAAQQKQRPQPRLEPRVQVVEYVKKPSEAERKFWESYRQTQALQWFRERELEMARRAAELWQKQYEARRAAEARAWAEYHKVLAQTGSPQAAIAAYKAELERVPPPLPLPSAPPATVPPAARAPEAGPEPVPATPSGREGGVFPWLAIGAGAAGIAATIGAIIARKPAGLLKVASKPVTEAAKTVARPSVIRFGPPVIEAVKPATEAAKTVSVARPVTEIARSTVARFGLPVVERAPVSIRRPVIEAVKPATEAAKSTAVKTVRGAAEAARTGAIVRAGMAASSRAARQAAAKAAARAVMEQATKSSRLAKLAKIAKYGTIGAALGLIGYGAYRMFTGGAEGAVGRPEGGAAPAPQPPPAPAREERVAEVLPFEGAQPPDVVPPPQPLPPPSPVPPVGGEELVPTGGEGWAGLPWEGGYGAPGIEAGAWGLEGAPAGAAPGGGLADFAARAEAFVKRHWPLLAAGALAVIAVIAIILAARK